MESIEQEAMVPRTVLNAVLQRLAAVEGRCDALTEVVLSSGRAVEDVAAHAQALADEVNRAFKAVDQELMVAHTLNRRIAQLTDAVAEHLAFSVPSPR